MVQKSETTTWDVYSTYQLVTLAGFLNHQQYYLYYLHPLRPGYHPLYFPTTKTRPPRLVFFRAVCTTLDPEGCHVQGRPPLHWEHPESIAGTSHGGRIWKHPTLEIHLKIASTRGHIFQMNFQNVINMSKSKFTTLGVGQIYLTEPHTIIVYSDALS